MAAPTLWAGDTGSLWLKPAVSPSTAEIVVRRAQAGPMPFTITSLGGQVLDETFAVIGPFGVPVYTIPASPYVFPAGGGSVTATSLALVPGEYRIRFGAQGLWLQVSVPGSPVVQSGFTFASDGDLLAEPVTGDYSFYVPAGTSSFGVVPDVRGTEADNYLSFEVRDGAGNLASTFACGEAESPHPSPCARRSVAVPADQTDTFWQLHIVHDGDVIVALDTIVNALAGDAAQWFEPHRFVIDRNHPGGRDCLSLGGAWDAALDRCTAADWEFHAADILEIQESVALVFEGAVANAGTVVNRGTLVNRGTITSGGTFSNFGQLDNQGTLTNSGTVSNPGSFANRGLLVNDGLFVNTGSLRNFCSGSIEGSGTLQGNAPLPDSLDVDGDGVCEADCAPKDPLLWTLPTEVATLTLTRGAEPDDTTLSWEPPAEGGATSWVYDLLRADFPDYPGVSQCVANGTATAHADDADRPVSGQTFFYLVLAENGCGNGSAGVASNGTPRATAGCP